MIDLHSLLRATRLLPLLAVAALPASLRASSAPIAPPDLIFAEQNGVVAVEAEHFIAQDLTQTRAFHLVSTINDPGVRPDPDPNHATSASGRAYVEVLPDTLTTDDEPATEGINISNTPGQHAVLSYRVRFSRGGRYYFWARHYATGTADNSVHVGLNGEWPESGRRWQSLRRNAWVWDCKQRTSQVPAGEPYSSYLDIPGPGDHLIQISMHEDGFELDKWVLARGVVFEPDGEGPTPVIAEGSAPPPFPVAARAAAARETAYGTTLPFPARWGEPPPVQTRDLRPLPAGFGSGSSTLARWIEQQLATDHAREAAGTLLPAAAFEFPPPGFELSDDEAFAGLPADGPRTASAFINPPVSGGRFHITLHTVGSDTTPATYELYVGGRHIGAFEPPLAFEPTAEGPAFNRLWEFVEINDGEAIELRATVGSSDADAPAAAAAARWSRLVLTPVDYDPTRPPPPAVPGVSSATYTRASSNAEGASANVLARAPNGDGAITVSGERLQWHTVTLDLDGPFAHEDDVAPNPFSDLAFNVTFTHASGSPRYTVPGFFAADGHAAESSATSGRTWRAHFTPDVPGDWTYVVSFERGPHAATYHGGNPVAPYHGLSGVLSIAPTDKAAPDFRARGRLTYTGERYLRFAGDGRPWLKAGPDAPETFLAYTGFDNTTAGREQVPLKSWTAHLRDWQRGDPTWRDGRGRGIIGALNYLAAQGLNTVSFLTYNAGGDGDNVWPFVDRNDKLHYDVSKLAQWDLVFTHAQRLGLHLHFKLQETEIDDQRATHLRTATTIPEAMDGGDTGPERRLYFRELIARFGHHLALTWNFGEENTQTYEEQIAMLNYVASIDPYQHHRVLHTYPHQQDEVYTPLLGDRSKLTGISLQNAWDTVHERTAHWLAASAATGHTWVVANDEQGSAAVGVPADPGYEGQDGVATTADGVQYDLHDIRALTLWGNLMAGGAGVEYYFGYQQPQNDLQCEDYRSRTRSWTYARLALEFFRALPVDLATLLPADQLAGVDWCLAAPGELYVVYLPRGGEATLDLTNAPGTYAVEWFDPRTGDRFPANPVTGGAPVSLGTAPDLPTADWALTLTRME
ncbi:DUF5060 domain-containing protein [Actomonas aquatica]|uniref:DUF5060 domain-containing protein n=1 Tax=Actomonas aquatica TaxID=2866162 RepID=A0ABZ1C6Y7_9BACT|nr:DUF5060 domain-containing protein [Opitutus sp. WL0086]WRQ87097.1 DUF5060 domain-containing protein [Opitutus sp. WL0086]